MKSEIRKTKIVATIGPACDSLEMMMAMIHAGMSVARLNLSHGTLEEQKMRIALLREASAELDSSTFRTGHADQLESLTRYQ